MIRFIPTLAVLSLAVSAGAAQAQAVSFGTSEVGLRAALAQPYQGSVGGLARGLANRAQRSGVSAPTAGLNLAQLAQLRAVLEDDDVPYAAKQNRIDTILGRN